MNQNIFHPIRTVHHQVSNVKKKSSNSSAPPTVTISISPTKHNVRNEIECRPESECLERVNNNSGRLYRSRFFAGSLEEHMAGGRPTLLGSTSRFYDALLSFSRSDISPIFCCYTCVFFVSLISNSLGGNRADQFRSRAVKAKLALALTKRRKFRQLLTRPTSDS